MVGSYGTRSLTRTGGIMTGTINESMMVFWQSLSIMGRGMLGIFTVMLITMIFVLLLKKTDRKR